MAAEDSFDLERRLVDCYYRREEPKFTLLIVLFKFILAIGRQLRGNAKFLSVELSLFSLLPADLILGTMGGGRLLL